MEKNSQNFVSLQNVSKVKLYNPSQYTFIGFFVSLLPVFIMSLSNSRFLRNGSTLRAIVMKFLFGYFSIFVVYYGLVVWVSIKYVDAIINKLSLGLLESMFMSNSSFIMVLINLAFLIVLVRFLNRNELPVFQEMEKSGNIIKRSPILPVVLGIIFTLFSYFYFADIVKGIALKNLERSYATESVNSYKEQKSLTDISENNAISSNESLSVNDICLFLSTDKVTQLTGLTVEKAESPIDRCFYANQEGLNVLITGTYNINSLQDQKSFYQKAFSQSQKPISFVSYEQVQKDAFLLKKDDGDTFNIIIDNKVYFIAPNERAGNLPTDVAVSLGAAILGVSYNSENDIDDIQSTQAVTTTRIKRSN